MTKKQVKAITDTFREAVRVMAVEASGGCAIQTRKDSSPRLRSDDAKRGWPCRTCFQFAAKTIGLTNTEAHAFWLLVLKIRGENVSEWKIKTQEVEFPS